ncbi:Uu.00g044290.m01.CDS01 [Anthostomella pinea]|uniref:Uu.00g044290.m01.CDS01 n=1 Tax=Anthostomella pinea TaxID=933095 RepID=A0AAI8VAY6_9PEZI|nr:Uu.00g044290.m01.CDS01 [Anthostomella pinea]
MATATPNQKKILNDQRDWDFWYEDFVSIVPPSLWRCLDPENPNPLPLQVHPVAPTFDSVQAGIDSYADLIANNQRVYLQFSSIYEREKKEYKEQEEMIRDLRDHIRKTVSETKKIPLRATQPL